ncbi:DinB family protein [Acidobacteria bacterium AB60]|nr:DinB family protein [Acidobacteria bacterium AB60]
MIAAIALGRLSLFVRPCARVLGYAWHAPRRKPLDIQKDLVAEFDREVGSTRKLLEAIPGEADFSWKPHEKSMALGKLAGHVADTAGDWALHTLTMDKLVWDPSMNAPAPSSKAELLESFEKRVGDAQRALAAMTPERWGSKWKFVAGDQTWIDDTK